MAGLDQFGNSPRSFVNHADNGGKTLTSTPRVLLGPGLAASITPASPLPGEVITLNLDVAESLNGRITTAESDIDTLQNFTTALSNDLNDVSSWEIPFDVSWDPPTPPATTATITIDWNATNKSRHARITTTGADSIELGASLNAVDGATYTVTFLGACGDRLYDTSYWVAGTDGYLYAASGDPDIIVYKFVYTSGKMRQVGRHFSQDI